MKSIIQLTNNSHGNIFYDTENSYFYFKDNDKEVCLNPPLQNLPNIVSITQPQIQPQVQPTNLKLTLYNTTLDDKSDHADFMTVGFESFVDYDETIFKIVNDNNAKTNITCLRTGMYIFKINLCYKFLDKELSQKPNRNELDGGVMFFATQNNSVHTEDTKIEQSMFYQNSKMICNNLNYEFIFHVQEPTIVNFFMFKDYEKSLKFENISEGGFLSVEFL